MKGLFRRLRDGYARFVDKQGFPIIITVCAGVITATALWTVRDKDTYVSPAPPVVDHVSAAQLIQQSLRTMSTAEPAPTDTPNRCCPPLENIDIIRGFSAQEFHQGSTTGIWMIHDAVDLSCNPGDKVSAMSDGLMIDSGKDNQHGVWVSVDHGDGIQALYSGMALMGAYIPGDQVKAGATLGFAGKGPLDEQDMAPHLHLRVTKDGRAIDPTTLWTD